MPKYLFVGHRSTETVVRQVNEESNESVNDSGVNICQSKVELPYHLADKDAAQALAGR